MFSKISQWISEVLGHSFAFLAALLVIIVWAILGPVFDYSDTWQLVINTSTTIITFLMVFVIQNTQNRNTLAIQLKLDEIIRAHKGAHNLLVDIEDMSDEELKKLHKHYESLAKKIKKHSKNGAKDTGTAED